MDYWRSSVTAMSKPNYIDNWLTERIGGSLRKRVQNALKFSKHSLMGDSGRSPQ